MTIMEGLAGSEDLLPSIIWIVVIIGVIYGVYFFSEQNANSINNAITKIYYSTIQIEKNLI